MKRQRLYNFIAAVLCMLLILIIWLLLAPADAAACDVRTERQEQLHIDANNLRAIGYKIANHRHHDAVWGHKFSLGAFQDGCLVGVAICGRPSSRRLDDGKTLEVTRLCTDGTRNACSFLYSAAAREAKRRGYEKIITYILQSENGASLKASNWKLEAVKCGKPSWDGPRYRARHEQEQLTLFPKKMPPPEYKQRWARLLKE